MSKILVLDIADAFTHTTLMSIPGSKRMRMTLGASIVVIAVGVIGVCIFGLSRADSGSLTVEPEQGTITSPATLQTDILASGGQAVKFAAGSNSTTTGFVTVCGTSLCVNGNVWHLYGAAIPTSSTPDQVMDLAVAAKLNTVRLTDFINSDEGTTGATDPAQWQMVDATIASAAQHNLRVILDLSTYRNMLYANNINPYTYDWQPFLKFVTTRVNTVNGRVYADDPTIAMISLAGEVEPPNGSDNHGVTEAQVTSFFGTYLTMLGSLAPNILHSTGGFLQLDWNSGIDWKTIMASSSDPVCDIHAYSSADITISLPAVASYCAGIGKPWITEEFGYDQTLGDATTASDFQSMYNLQSQYKSAGASFWHLGFEQLGVNGKTDTYDVNTTTPLTFQVVQKNAP